ncbi:benzoate transporter [Acinetobacter sp. ANC 4470]|uniref:glycosyltransferase family 2 protein n=1 Tax=Acinetobacter sp. ANC 4470 TaxID=1977881 RepID=UPI000A35625A|nr:glycosyltransferase family A protein [Acinetobacter sp. ANC 4470]OTG66883.1 benzoate transporter [Acinetobacter sp. ANC 4470]
MKKPLISVVIPMYNSTKTIVKALDSIKNQSYKGGYQIIVVNDGSKDDSYEVVGDYLLKNPNLNIKLVDQVNGGVSKARNVGLKLADGDFVAFLDSDDEWLSDKIEKQLLVFEKNPDIDVLATNRNNEYFETFLGHKFTNVTKISSRLLLLKNFLSPPTVMMRNSVVSEVGFFDEGQKYAEEGNYWIRVCDKSNCYLLNESLVVTGGGKPSFGHSGLSANLWEMEKGELKNITLALRMKIINIFEFSFLCMFSLLKYIRRLLIVGMRK